MEALEIYFYVYKDTSRSLFSCTCLLLTTSSVIIAQDVNQLRVLLLSFLLWISLTFLCHRQTKVLKSFKNDFTLPLENPEKKVGQHFPLLFWKDFFLSEFLNNSKFGQKNQRLAREILTFWSYFHQLQYRVAILSLDLSCDWLKKI